MAELIQVKHSNSAQKYIDDFELSLTLVHILPEHALSIFIAGLDPVIQAHVRMFNPITIAHASNLAKFCETTKSPSQKQLRYKQPFQNPKRNTSLNQTPILANRPAQKPTLNRTTKVLQILLDSGSTLNFKSY